MLDVHQVAEKVYRFETPIARLASVFAVYLIAEGGGVLIEPGPTAAVAAIREAMSYVGMKDLAYIIPTHIHMDHAGGMGTLAQFYPGAQVLVHPRARKHAVDPSRLIEGTRMVFGPSFESTYGPIEPVPESQVRVPEDGEIVSVNGRELQIVYSPGHAQHHIAVFDRSVRGIFCGEALGMLVDAASQFALPAVAPPNFDQALYLGSMERLRLLNPQVLFYSHGGVGREPDVLISTAAESTRIFGDIILTALKEGAPQPEIARRINDYAIRRFSVRIDEAGLAMLVSGYTVYYKNTGLA